MSPEDEITTRKIVHEVIAELRRTAETDEFYIKRKDFYDNYKRSEKLFNLIDDAATFLGRTILYAVLLGVIGLFIIGSGKLPWK